MIIKLLNELGIRKDKYSEKFNRVRKHKEELKNTITEIKNTLGRINNRSEDTDEQISKLEDRVVENTTFFFPQEKRYFKK